MLVVDATRRGEDNESGDEDEDTKQVTRRPVDAAAQLHHAHSREYTHKTLVKFMYIFAEAGVVDRTADTLSNKETDSREGRIGATEPRVHDIMW